MRTPPPAIRPSTTTVADDLAGGTNDRPTVALGPSVTSNTPQQVLQPFAWLDDADIDTLDRIASSQDYLDELFAGTAAVGQHARVCRGVAARTRAARQRRSAAVAELLGVASRVNAEQTACDAARERIAVALREENALLATRSRSTVAAALAAQRRAAGDRSELLFASFAAGPVADADTAEAFVHQMLALRTDYHRAALLRDRLDNTATVAER